LIKLPNHVQSLESKAGLGHEEYLWVGTLDHVFRLGEAVGLEELKNLQSTCR